MQSLVGRELGQYRVLEELGRGSMGLVYKGLQTTLDREVAIKVLAPSLAGDKELVERFLREARLAGKLNHPNIVHVYDQRQEEDIFYIVMEFVDGKTLRQMLGNRGRFAPERTLEIALQVCHALRYAHDLGIVHRDIKPDNIMLDKRGVVKVADFGLAKGISSQTLTNPGAFVGSPYYISPEQLRGDRLDFRTDIYSLGRVMYRLVAGRTPFESEDLLSLIYMEMNNPVPPFSEFDLEVPADFESVVMKAQARDREQRFASAEEMLEALQAVKANLETLKAPVQAGPLLSRRVKAPISAAPLPAVTPAPATVLRQAPEKAVKPHPAETQPAVPSPKFSISSRIFAALSYFGLFGVLCLLLGRRNRLVLLHSRQAVVLHVFRLATVCTVLFAFDLLRPTDAFLLATLGITFPNLAQPNLVDWAVWFITGVFWLIALLGLTKGLQGTIWRMPVFGPFSEIHVVEEFLGIDHEISVEMKDQERDEEEKRKLNEIQQERWRRYEEAMESTQRERLRQERLQQISSRIDEILKRAEQINDKFAFGEIDKARFDDLRELYGSELATLKDEARLLGVSFSNKRIIWVTDRKRDPYQGW